MQVKYWSSCHCIFWENSVKFASWNSILSPMQQTENTITLFGRDPPKDYSCHDCWKSISYLTGMILLKKNVHNKSIEQAETLGMDNFDPRTISYSASVKPIANSTHIIWVFCALQFQRRYFNSAFWNSILAVNYLSKRHKPLCNLVEDNPRLFLSLLVIIHSIIWDGCWF